MEIKVRFSVLPFLVIEPKLTKISVQMTKTLKILTSVSDPVDSSNSYHITFNHAWCF